MTGRKNARFMRPGEYVEGCDCGGCIATRQQLRTGLKPWDGRLRSKPKTTPSYKKEREGQSKRASGCQIIEFPGIESLMGETKSLMGETDE